MKIDYCCGSMMKRVLSGQFYAEKNGNKWYVNGNQNLFSYCPFCGETITFSSFETKLEKIWYEHHCWWEYSTGCFEKQVIRTTKDWAEFIASESDNYLPVKVNTTIKWEDYE